jgi:hypothetical protein
MPEYELWHLESAAPIHTYVSEVAALAFVRDVVVFGGRDIGARLQLFLVDASGLSVVAEGEELMRRAIEDRLL